MDRPKRSPLQGISVLARRLGGARPPRDLDDLPCLPVAARDVRTLDGPDAFREALLGLIAGARQRILIATLYLQDDAAGREVLEALYAAKAARPRLEVAVFVDWHRAQRGLVGAKRGEGNAARYREMAKRLGAGVSVLGVPVQTREVMGVMHLKGFVFDDEVLYSGASLNDVYLHVGHRYRLDRYHLVRSRALAGSLSTVLRGVLEASPAVRPLDMPAAALRASLRPAIARFRGDLARARYPFAQGAPGPGEVGITPLLGLGPRGNALNAAILGVIRHARESLLVYTPYFNLPGVVRRAMDERLREGCRVMLVVGDKVANDFYLSPDEPFHAIGLLPYLYEGNLRRYCQARRGAIDAGLLDVRLWRDANHTFHLKGLLADDDWALLTGSNVNPRAWRLDLENGLLVRDPQRLLSAQHAAERERILARTRRVAHVDDLETIDDYPAPVRRMLRRLARARLDRLANQVL